jgi:hypothetical protein
MFANSYGCHDCDGLEFGDDTEGFVVPEFSLRDFTGEAGGHPLVCLVALATLADELGLMIQ